LYAEDHFTPVRRVYHEYCEINVVFNSHKDGQFVLGEDLRILSLTHTHTHTRLISHFCFVGAVCFQTLPAFTSYSAQRNVSCCLFVLLVVVRTGW